MSDEALFAKPSESGDLVFKRYVGRIGAVQVVQTYI